MKPIDVVLDRTLEFLRRVLPATPLRMLEVGCGRGDLARRLVAEGFEVTALDTSPEAVRLAQAAGAPAVEADFLDFADAPYDVVLFTRSLHHMRSLPAAVARAAEMLRPDGWLIADEFGRERVNRETAAWFYDNRELLATTGVLSVVDGAGKPDVGDPSALDPLERWRAEHRGDAGHSLHAGSAMLAEIGNRFLIIHREDTPYLYRSLIQWIEETPRGWEVTDRLLQIEARRIAQGWLAPTGFRIAAKLKR